MSKQQWLNENIEEVIDPNIAVVDCHHHFYRDRGAYFTYQPDYVAEDLALDLNDGHKVIATIAVECGYGYRDSGPESMRSVAETEFMLQCGESYRSQNLGDTHVCKGIISFADLRLGSGVEELLLAHREVAGEQFCGVRQLAAKQIAADGLEKSESLLLNPEFQQGFGRLSDHNLVFDAWVLHPQIPEVFELAKKFPDITIVLNHFGAPLGIGPYAERHRDVMKQWQKDMAQLAELHNVMVKTGGLNMKLNGFDWEQNPAPPSSDEMLEASRDYYLRTIDLFSPERCMFESNFPVDKISVSYRTLWNAYKKIAREFNADEASGMLAGNAQRIYHLVD